MFSRLRQPARTDVLMRSTESMAAARHTRTLLLCICTLATVGQSLVGCDRFPESTFVLASDSRLPIWIKVPPGVAISSLKLTISYYIRPLGANAVFSLQDKDTVIEKLDAKVICRTPFTVPAHSSGSASGYPLYQAVSVKSVTEIIEHRRMEPVFYVTDNASVWKQYRASGCS